MTSPLRYVPSVVLAYRRRGEEGVTELAEELERKAHERPGGKFGKREAAYLPQAPFPPTLWRTSCGRCRFWEEGEPGTPGRCHVVGREGDPFGGEAIHYRGWCAFWTPPKGEPPFAWVGERLRPDGKSAVRGEYDPELTAKERRRRARVEERAKPGAREAEPDGGVMEPSAGVADSDEGTTKSSAGATESDERVREPDARGMSRDGGGDDGE